MGTREVSLIVEVPLYKTAQPVLTKDQKKAEESMKSGGKGALGLDELAQKLRAALKEQDREQQRSMLRTSDAMARGFKQFTQCIGHDLRT